MMIHSSVLDLLFVLVSPFLYSLFFILYKEEESIKRVGSSVIFQSLLLYYSLP